METRLAEFKKNLQLVVMDAPLEVILGGGCIAGMVPFSRTGDHLKVDGNETWVGNAFGKIGGLVTQRMEKGAELLENGSYELVFYVRRAKEVMA